MIKTIVYRDHEETLTIPDKNEEVSYLVKEASRITKISPTRIRLYYVHDNNEIVIQNQHELIEMIQANRFVVKDSGPQFSFMINDLFEYIPPLFIWIGFLLCIKPENNNYIKIATCMWMFHYIKRSFEAVFIHTYSHKTIPIFSVMDNSCFKNCIYYWFFAFLISYSVLSGKKNIQVKNMKIIFIILFIVSELLNFYCHLKLRLLRPKGSLKHYCPRGFLFDHITAPNYTFEILSWIFFYLFTNCISVLIFAFCGGFQMFLWADEKRKRLSVNYKEVQNRGRILPFF